MAQGVGGSCVYAPCTCVRTCVVEAVRRWEHGHGVVCWGCVLHIETIRPEEKTPGLSAREVLR